MKRLLLLIPVLIFLMNCAISENFGEKADSSKTQVRIFNSTYEDVYKLAIQTAGERNWTIKHSDFKAGFFSAHYPQTLKNWDDQVNVSIHDNLNDSITITVKSNLGQSPNRKIVADFLNALEDKIKTL